MLSVSGWLDFVFTEQSFMCNCSYGPPRSPGGLLPSTRLTRSGSVFLSEYSCSRIHLCSQSCSFWQTTRVVCKHLTQGAPTNLNKSELNALYLWDPELRVALVYTHFLFAWSHNVLWNLFWVFSSCLVTSSKKFYLIYSNLWKQILKSFPSLQHVNSRCLLAFFGNFITMLCSLIPRHHGFEIKLKSPAFLLLKPLSTSWQENSNKMLLR